MKVHHLGCHGTNMDEDRVVGDQTIQIMVVPVDLGIMHVSLLINKGTLFEKLKKVILYNLYISVVDRLNPK